jgi:hypothetical protein
LLACSFIDCSIICACAVIGLTQASIRGKLDTREVMLGVLFVSPIILNVYLAIKNVTYLLSPATVQIYARLPPRPSKPGAFTTLAHFYHSSLSSYGAYYVPFNIASNAVNVVLQCASFDGGIVRTEDWRLVCAWITAFFISTTVHVALLLAKSRRLHVHAYSFFAIITDIAFVTFQLIITGNAS